MTGAYFKGEKFRNAFDMMLMMAISVGSIVYVFQISNVRDITIYWLNQVGPAVYLLTPLAIIFLSVLILFSLGRLDDRFPSAKELLMIKEYAPVLGMLGTVLGLVFSLQHYDFSKDYQLMIQSVISGLLKALISTAVGIILAVFAGNLYDRLFANNASENNQDGIRDHKACEKSMSPANNIFDEKKSCPVNSVHVE